MCGIVGYLGKEKALGVVSDGLKALEYRGYDSAGVAYFEKGKTGEIKKVGRVKDLAKEIESKGKLMPDIAIGHTRWATHGPPTLTNAHPHHNADKSIFLVHNGIIENHDEIRAELSKKGYEFTSQTDTEVVAHLLDYYAGQLRNFDDAFVFAIQQLRGAYAIVAINHVQPEKLYAARLGSPLILGVKKGEYFLASDPTAIMEHTKDVVYIDDNEAVIIGRKDYKIINLKDSAPVKRPAETLDFDFEQASKGDYADFMLKEIFEAPQTIKLASLGRIRLAPATVKLGGLESVESQLAFVDRLVITACGTSYYAGLLGEYLIEEIAGLPVEVQLASEFKYRSEPFSRSTAILAISQSGETADTITALKKYDDMGVLRLGVVNAVGSTIARMTDAGVYCHAGPEQAVASTKAFVAQVTVLALIALQLSKGAYKNYKTMLSELDGLPAKAEKILASEDQIKKLAEKYCAFHDFLFIGRGYAYPTALEGALKLKEITYIHAEGYAAGEMKHGPLAMIDEKFATVAIAPDGQLLEKTYSNIEEIKARGGPVLAIATEGNKKIKALANDVIYVPASDEKLQPILMTIVTQLFAYYAAKKLGKDVDRPRNLAKSVTVE